LPTISAFFRLEREREDLTIKMSVMQNKFIARKRLLGGKKLGKSAGPGEVIKDAFSRETDRMRFSFVSFRKKTGRNEAGNNK
jgi:hypothetical protein